MTTVDPLAALVAYLKADSAVAALASARVYGAELAPAEATSMPRHAVVCYATGGQPEHYVKLQAPRVDVMCYGPTPYEAKRLYLTVYDALKGAEREEQTSALIHTALMNGGPLQNREPDTHWPFVWSSWTVTVSEESTVS